MRPSAARAPSPTITAPHAGPIGIIGSTSANALASKADVVLAIGTGYRISQLVPGRRSPRTQFVSVNTARFDAVKHGAPAVVGDALETVQELDAALGDWRAAPQMMSEARAVCGMEPTAGRAPGSNKRVGRDLGPGEKQTNRK